MRDHKIQKCLTYEEIGKRVNISPQQVHKIEKEAFNKMFSRLSCSTEFTPSEIVHGMCRYFGVSHDQVIKKLDPINKNKLLLAVQEETGKDVSEFLEETECESIEELFK